MNGINFVTDDKGKPTAVLIDLKKHRQVWEDVYDSILIEKRKSEKRIPWETAKKILAKNTK